MYRIKPLQWEMSSAYEIRSASARTFYGFYTVITEVSNGRPSGKYTGYMPSAVGDAVKFTNTSFEACLEECDRHHVSTLKQCLEEVDGIQH